MQFITEFFKPALNLEQEKFFKKLESEVDRESIRPEIAIFDKEAHERYESHVQNNLIYLDSVKKNMVLATFKKNTVLTNLNRKAANCAYKADVQGFKRYLYAMLTLSTVQDVMVLLKEGFHEAWYDDGSDTVSRAVLKGIHIRTAHYYGDAKDKKERYMQSQDWVNHKQLIDILKKIGLSEALEQDVKDGQEERDHRHYPYLWKVPEEIFEYILSGRVGTAPQA